MGCGYYALTVKRFLINLTEQYSSSPITLNAIYFTSAFICQSGQTYRYAMINNSILTDKEKMGRTTNEPD